MSTGASRARATTGRSLLYRQLPNGTLAAPEPFAPVWNVAVRGLAVGDVDGDDRDDVVVATDLGVNVFRPASTGLSPGRLSSRSRLVGTPSTSPT